MPQDFEYLGREAHLRVGDRLVSVYRLEQRATYAGLIEGAPIRPLNERQLEPLRAQARSRGTYLIEPVIRKAEITPDGWNLGGHYPEFLPDVSVAMWLRSHGPAHTPDADHSTLLVLFFQDRFAPPLDDHIARALRELDWNTHAQDGQI